MLFKKLENRIGGAQVNYHFNFSLRNRYVYVQTSKCACSHLKAALTVIELSDDSFFDVGYRHTDRRIVIPDALGKTPHQPVNRSVFVKPYQLGIPTFDALLSSPHYFKFAVVRNPYSRALSAYLDTVKRNRSAFRMTLKEDVAAVKGVSPEAVHPENVSFLEFLMAIDHQVDSKGWRHVDQHYRSQSQHISDDIVSYDRIFRLERFSEALGEIESRIGRRLPEVRRGPHMTDADEKLSEFFVDPQCRSLVEKVYRTDLERFEYGFPGE